ncbi:MAG: 2-amino-4-hydroxy-6-hydroxymethyldihydropteridine diphosphokinase [Pseudomonas fluorescens]|nr:2-amino-4-hydroxy-6-hydroxymethyldihydropteridine diphosphokinase [Pseudomonas fluorescens]
MERIYIGMGSNLAAPADQLRSAVEALAHLPQTALVGVSAFYQSDSLLPGQPRYTNAVAALDSTLAPLDLLDALQAIENGQGRERLERWGPRTLDLDILLFGDRLIDEPRLKVPHYHMHESGVSINKNVECDAPLREQARSHIGFVSRTRSAAESHQLPR